MRDTRKSSASPRAKPDDQRTKIAPIFALVGGTVVALLGGAGAAALMAAIA